MEESVIIIKIMRDVHAYHDFFEKVPREFQRLKLRVLLLFRIHLISRLDINTAVVIVHNEVNLTLNAFVLLSFCDHANIYGIATLYKLVVNNVLIM